MPIPELRRDGYLPEGLHRQLEELKAWRDRVLREPAEDPLHMHVEVVGIEKMIARLQEEIAAYESAKPASLAAAAAQGK